jgi:hypothetical protein
LAPRSKRILATSLFATTWIVAVALGLRTLFSYESTPGSVGALPPMWAALHLERAKDRPTLVMVAHPQCPCTNASMGELAQLMAHLKGKVRAYVLFVEPQNAGPDWRETGLRHSADAIPGVQVVFDRGGIEARRFGAETSGHTFLFGPDGRLLFSGGITASRGHAGDNPGEDAIIALVNHEPPARSKTLVFG